MNLKADVEVEEFTTSHLFYVSPTQNQLLLFAENRLLLGIDLIFRRIKSKGDEHEVFLGYVDVSPNRRLDCDLLTLE